MKLCAISHFMKESTSELMTKHYHDSECTDLIEVTREPSEQICHFAVELFYSEWKEGSAQLSYQSTHCTSV